MKNTALNKVSTEKDITNVEKLGREIWSKHYIKILSQSQIDYMLEKFQSTDSIKTQIKENYEYYLIENNNENVGYTAFLSKENYMFLSKLYIKEKKRGQGIGKQAFNFIKEKCKEKNLNSIRLNVNKYNSLSIEAYKKMGFAIINSMITDVGNGYIMDDYELECQILD